MQYKIPQNVQVEDKIVGPLTLKQLIILGVGGGIAYVIYTTIGKDYELGIWLIIPLLIVGFTLLVAFGKIANVTFGKWCLLMVEKFVNPQKRTFVMGGADLYQATLFAEKNKKVQTTVESATKAERDKERLQKLSQISKVLDSYGKPQAS